MGCTVTYVLWYGSARLKVDLMKEEIDCIG